VGNPKSLYVLPDVTHKCLCLFRACDIAERLQKVRQHSIADTKARQFARMLASQSDLVAWDSQGRIRVKDALLHFADLKDQVALVGAFDRFELWNPDQFQGSGSMDRGGLEEAAKYVGF
jgi:division/cell wall cluster transcriptional repressor MraZ